MAEKQEAKKTGARSSKEVREPLKARMTASLVRHPVMTGCLLAILVFLCLAVLLWYTVFSGLSSSADFIYSNF